MAPTGKGVQSEEPKLPRCTQKGRDVSKASCGIYAMLHLLPSHQATPKRHAISGAIAKS